MHKLSIDNQTHKLSIDNQTHKLSIDNQTHVGSGVGVSVSSMGFYYTSELFYVSNFSL